MRVRVFVCVCVQEPTLHFSVSASCCGVGVEDSNVPEAGGPAGAGGTAGGVAVIPDRPPLELDKLPPYHDVAPSPGECYYEMPAVRNSSYIYAYAPSSEIVEKWPLVTRMFPSRYVHCDREHGSTVSHLYVSFRSPKKVELLEPDLAACS